VNAPAGSGWPLPPHASSFSNLEFGLVYLGQRERNLGNLVKNLGIGIHTPNLLELFLVDLGILAVFRDVYPL